MIYEFKNKTVHKRFCVNPVHPNLVRVNEWIYDRYKKLYMTSSYRPEKIYEGESGIHQLIPIRAEDLRSLVYFAPENIKHEINNAWEYDPERPGMYKVCVYHNTGQGWHFHIQVHNNTRLRHGY